MTLDDRLLLLGNYQYWCPNCTNWFSSTIAEKQLNGEYQKLCCCCCHEVYHYTDPRAETAIEQYMAIYQQVHGAN